MGRIKTFVLLGAALSTVLMLSGCGNTLLADVESRVSAATAITIDFHYDGPFELSKDYPVYLRIFPNPFDDRISIDDLKTDIKLEKNDTVAVQASSLYPSKSGKYFAFIIHDLNNNGIDSGDGSDDFVFVNNGTNNCGEIPEDDIVHDGHIHTLPDANLMSVGERYAINFNLEKDKNDVFEPADNTYVGNTDDLHPGDINTLHKLGWEDIDFIKLIPTENATYTVTVSNFNSTIPISISISGFDGSGLVNVGSPVTPYSIEANLNTYGSYQYFFRISSPANAMGYYTVSFVKNP